MNKNKFSIIGLAIGFIFALILLYPHFISLGNSAEVILIPFVLGVITDYFLKKNK